MSIMVQPVKSISLDIKNADLIYKVHYFAFQPKRNILIFFKMTFHD